MERVYRQSTRLAGALLVVLGVAMVATTIAGGGGPLALGFLLGLAFAGIGAARLYLASPRRAGGEET